MWRPLKGPVQSSPLGMIDAATVQKEDYINYRLHFPDRIGYNYGVAHNSKHKYASFAALQFSLSVCVCCLSCIDNYEQSVP